MSQWLAPALVALLVVLILGPEFLFHLLHLGVTVRGRGPDRLAITFDDGPDPAYTPRILAELNRRGEHATFFVTAARAAAYPELVKKMRAAGHEVALHGYSHRHNWLLGPRRTKDEIVRGKKILTDILGEPPRFYRPPWGAFNLFTVPVARRQGLRTVLWSAVAKDWLAPPPEVITARLLRRSRPGSILLLHDAGGRPGAPEKTVAAMGPLLEGLAQRGLRSVTLSELLPPQPGTRVRLGEGWEAFFARRAGLKPVGDPAGLLYYAPVTYRGPVVRDGAEVVLRPGDRVVELHFRSRVLAEAGPHRARHMLAAALPLLAREAGRPELSDRHVFYGTTLFHRGAEHFGFRVLDLPRGLGPWLLGHYLRLLLALYHPEGRRRLGRRREELRPRVVVLSREDLLRRYG